PSDETVVDSAGQEPQQSHQASSLPGEGNVSASSGSPFQNDRGGGLGVEPPGQGGDQPLGHGSLHEPWLDDCHGNARASKLDAQGFQQGGQRSLARAVADRAG